MSELQVEGSWFRVQGLASGFKVLALFRIIVLVVVLVVVLVLDI